MFLAKNLAKPNWNCSNFFLLNQNLSHMQFTLELGFEQVLVLVRQLPTGQKLRLFREIEKDIQTEPQALPIIQRTDMTMAAQLLLEDYVSDEELTSFTTLDPEPFQNFRC